MRRVVNGVRYDTQKGVVVGEAKEFKCRKEPNPRKGIETSYSRCKPRDRH